MGFKSTERKVPAFSVGPPLGMISGAEHRGAHCAGRPTSSAGGGPRTQYGIPESSPQHSRSPGQFSKSSECSDTATGSFGWSTLTLPALIVDRARLTRRRAEGDGRCAPYAPFRKHLRGCANAPAFTGAGVRCEPLRPLRLSCSWALPNSPWGNGYEGPPETSSCSDRCNQRLCGWSRNSVAITRVSALHGWL